MILCIEFRIGSLFALAYYNSPNDINIKYRELDFMHLCSIIIVSLDPQTGVIHNDNQIIMKKKCSEDNEWKQKCMFKKFISLIDNCRICKKSFDATSTEKKKKKKKRQPSKHSQSSKIILNWLMKMSLYCYIIASFRISGTMSP